MNIRKNIAYGLALTTLVAGITGFLGCKPKSQWQNQEPAKQEQKEEKTASYFAKVPLSSKGSLKTEVGDFNNDGNLDLIVIAEDSREWEAKLYFFKGDGKGNFTQENYNNY